MRGWGLAFSLDLVAGKTLDVADELEAHEVGLDLSYGDICGAAEVIDVDGCGGDEVEEGLLIGGEVGSEVECFDGLGGFGGGGGIG